MGDQMCSARWKVARICQMFCLVGAENLFKSLEWLQIISAMGIVLSTSPRACRRPSFPNIIPWYKCDVIAKGWSMLSLPPMFTSDCVISAYCCARELFHFIAHGSIWKRFTFTRLYTIDAFYFSVNFAKRAFHHRLHFGVKCDNSIVAVLFLEWGVCFVETVYIILR